MAVDQQILVAGQSAVPLAYTVPPTIEAALLCVNATINGTNAPSSFLATVEIWSDGGVCVARCPCFTTIAAGGSAEISWFRLRNQDSSTTAESTYEEAAQAPNEFILYWKLDEAASATIAVDASGQGHNGTQPATGITAGVTGLADGLAVRYANAGFFGHNWDGGPNTVTRWAGTFTQTGEISAELWIQTTQSGAGGVVMFNTSQGSTAAPYVDIALTAGGAIQFRVKPPGVAVNLNGVTVVNDGARHYIACTYDGATMTIYVDGALDNSVAMAAGLINLPGDFLVVVVGGLESGSQLWADGYTGTADEVGFRNAALTATEVATIYAARNP